MKIVIDETYYCENKDRKRFNKWLKEKSLKQKDVANILEISCCYLTLVLNGKRALTKKMVKKLEQIGFNFLEVI